MFSKFFQLFGFTRNESRVVLFLVITFLFGVGIQLYKTNLSPGRAYDYAASDSEFTLRSRQRTSFRTSIVDGHEVDSGVAGLQPTKIQDTALSRGALNINTATKDELITLPGIGEAMAERIILYREENGPFTSVVDLVNIKGIGKKKLERIAPYCTVGK